MLEDGVILRTVDLGGGHHWAFDESQYYTLRALCAKYAGIDGTREADMGEITAKTNAMSAAIQSMENNQKPDDIIKKRMVEKKNFGMSTLKNQYMANVNKVYNPKYERPSNASPRNSLAVQIYESLFYNKQRVRVSYDHFSELKHRVMSAPDEAMSATEIIVNRLVETGAGEEDKSKSGYTDKVYRHVKQVGRIGKKVLKNGTQMLKDKAKTVFVPGPTGKALFTIAILFCMRAFFLTVLDNTIATGRITEKQSQVTMWHQWTSNLWEKTTIIPMRGTTGLFESNGITENYTAFLSSFWDQSTGGYNEFWQQIDQYDFTDLKGFMKEHVPKLYKGNEASSLSISKAMRFAFLEKGEIKINDEEKDSQLQKVVIDLKRLKGEKNVLKNCNDGDKYCEIIQNPYNDTLSNFESAKSSKENGGTMLEAQYAIESQSFSWTNFVSRTMFSIFRIFLRGAKVDEAGAAALKTYFAKQMKFLPGYNGNNLFASYITSILSENSFVDRWDNYDKIFACCITFTAYVTWKFLSHFLELKRQYIEGLDSDGENPAPKSNNLEKFISFTNFTQALTAMILSFSMLYTVVTVGDTDLSNSSLDVKSVERYFANMLTSIWVEELILFTMGFKKEQTTQSFMLQQGITIMTYKLLQTYIDGSFQWVLGYCIFVFSIQFQNFKTMMLDRTSRNMRNVKEKVNKWITPNSENEEVIDGDEDRPNNLNNRERQDVIDFISMIEFPDENNLNLIEPPGRNVANYDQARFDSLHEEYTERIKKFNHEVAEYFKSLDDAKSRFIEDNRRNPKVELPFLKEVPIFKKVLVSYRDAGDIVEHNKLQYRKYNSWRERNNIVDRPATQQQYRGRIQRTDNRRRTRTPARETANRRRTRTPARETTSLTKKSSQQATSSQQDLTGVIDSFNKLMGNYNGRNNEKMGSYQIKEQLDNNYQPYISEQPPVTANQKLSVLADDALNRIKSIRKRNRYVNSQERDTYYIN